MLSGSSVLEGADPLSQRIETARDSVSLFCSLFSPTTPTPPLKQILTINNWHKRGISTHINLFIFVQV